MRSQPRLGICIPDRTANNPSSSSHPAAFGAPAERNGRKSRCELGFLDNGFRCTLPAEAYIEFHMVGHCKRSDCDGRGNACGFVCAEHRDALAYTAQCLAAEMTPTALRRLFKQVARCPTCDRALSSPSDILQISVTM